MMGMGREEARKKPETGVHVWVGWLVGWLQTTNKRQIKKRKQKKKQTDRDK